ncbi:hypothetical protein KFL_004740090 [Klebsormidium nitens]|uniref:Uncharacterized protein n=1 Tax=Klebsormidium nitens TaxID=105231 RepID=A0A1Y1IHK1_KLENI|nr:hypothetical protein KFL_004740090 [Klebsormidium nitens]|eukprot:GAQ88969.1 hypothetical protein KFL_004740090 [Klebsormidium nitens]
MELPMVLTQSGSDQLWTSAASRRTTTRESHGRGDNPASLTSAALPGLLSAGTSSNFIADDPSPFPSGCAQPSSTPLIHSHKPTPHSNADTPDTEGPLGPTFVGSVYTMGDRARKQMVSLGPVQKLPPGNPLPGFLEAMNDMPVGRAVEKGLLWWVNRGREKPRFEFFLDKEAASRQVDVTKAGWLLSPEVSSSTVVECSLQDAYNCIKMDSDAFKLVPNKKQVRAAKRILRRQFGWRAARGFTGTPIFVAHNFNVVVPSEDGVRWYTPCFLDKSALHSALDRSVDLHFEGLIRTRRAQRYSSLDPGAPPGGLGAPPSDADGLEEDTSLLEPSDVKDLMEEAPSGTSAGVDKILLNLAAVYAQDLFDDVVLGNKWGRSAVGLQPHFSISVDSFEDCAAAAEAAAIAQERLKQELAHRLKESEGGATAESGERGGIRRWGPDAFKDSGPPGSSLLGDVVREVEAKRNSGFDGGARVGSQVGSGSDAGMNEQADSPRSRENPERTIGTAKGNADDLLGRDPADGDYTGGTSDQRNGIDSGVGAHSADGSSSRRTAGGAADKPWWEIIMDHPAFKRNGREALSGSGRTRDGVVVNRGPGWEIVRRGPFWNRQYVLEQVAEGADAGGRSAEGHGVPSENLGSGTGTGNADAERRIGGGLGNGRKASSGEGLRAEEEGGSERRDDNSVSLSSAKGHSQEAEGVAHSKSASEVSDSHSGDQPGRSVGVPGSGGHTQAASGRFISQQEWNAVKAAVKDTLKGSPGTSADVRQQKWEALKASVEAKLALKYRERGAGRSAGGGTSTSFEVEERSRPVGDGPVESGRRVAGKRGSSSTGRTGVTGNVRKTGDGIDGKKKHLDMGVTVDPRSKARPGAAEAAAGQLGVAGVVRDEARMALIAVMSGSPQEKNLQGALDAVTRDIHGKSANGSETSMMFIANVGSLFVPLGSQSGGPQGGMLCKSAGNSCKLSEVFPAKWIESLRDTLEDFTYHDPYAFIISEERFDIPPFDENELTFTDFMLESLSRCSNLKRLKLCTRKVFRHQGCSWQLSFPNNLSELRLSNCSGDQLVGVLNQVSLTQACPFLKSLSLQGRLEGTLCLNFERLESLNLDLASRAEALRIDLTSTPSLQRISLRFEEEHRKNDDFEEDRFTLVVRHKLLSLTALDLINATWEQTVQLLDNSPSLQDFTFNQGVLGLDDDEMEINLTVMLQKVAISNPLLEYLKVETSKLPPSGLMERGPSLRHLRHLRFCNLDIFDLLELTKNLHSLLPNSPLLEKVAVEVYVMLDSERSEETDGLIDSMNSFFKLQRTFPGVIFELENMER